jgi:hypothetical protein
VATSQISGLAEAFGTAANVCVGSYNTLFAAIGTGCH